MYADDAALLAAFAGSEFQTRIVCWDDPAVGWGHFDACVIRSTCDYVPRHAEFLKWLRTVSQYTRLLNPVDMVIRNTSKRYLVDLQERGVPIVPTEFIKRGSDVNLEEVLTVRGWERAVVKPEIGASSSGVIIAESDNIVRSQRHIGTLLKETGALVQEFLPSVINSGEISAMFFGGDYSHAVSKIPAAGDYRVQEEFGGSCHAVTLASPEMDVARKAMDTVGDTLYARVDLLSSQCGALVSELELVEPELFFRFDESAAHRMVAALKARLDLDR